MRPKRLSRAARAERPKSRSIRVSLTQLFCFFPTELESFNFSEIKFMAERLEDRMMLGVGTPMAKVVQQRPLRRLLHGVEWFLDVD